ncbi:MAG: Ig-like domain-containing protein [Propionicimonas sp.]|nr:Ig-like domain-containing protein [Propionicimonas sp.]
MPHSGNWPERLRKPVVWLSCIALLSAGLSSVTATQARAEGEGGSAPIQAYDEAIENPDATESASSEPVETPSSSETPTASETPTPQATDATSSPVATAEETPTPTPTAAETTASTTAQANAVQQVAPQAIATPTVPADASAVPRLQSPDPSPKVDADKFPIGGPGNTTGAVKPDVAYTTAQGGRVEIYSSVGDIEDGTLDWRQVNLFSYLVNSVPKGSKLYTTVYNTLWDSTIPKKDSNGKWYLTVGGKKVTKDIYGPTVAFMNQLNQYSTADQRAYINVLGSRATLNDAVKAKSSLGLLLSKNYSNVARLCNTGLGACFATTTSGSPLMHSKYAIFQKTNDSTGKQWSNVVWITSANLNGQSGGRKSNLSIVLYGDQTAFQGLLNGVWNPTIALAGKKGTTHKFTKFPAVFRNAATKGVASADGQFVYYASPRKPGQDLEADFLASKTNKNLTKSLGKTVKKTGCNVYLVHSLFSTARKSVANGLAALQKDGCNVRLILGESSMANIADSYFSMGTSLRELVSRVEFSNVHDKSLVVSYTANGQRSATTWLGSANLNGTSMYFDELSVKATSTVVTDAAMLQFDRLYPVARSGKNPKVVKSVAITPTSYNLRAGDSTTLKLKAVLNPSNPTITGVYWRSSNNNIASVSSSGQVTAKTLPAGVESATATITATSLSKVKTGSATVTVYAAGVTMPSNSTPSSPSTAKQTVTVPPYLSIPRYAGPGAKRKVVVTWGQGGTELSGKVQLQYLNGSGKWVGSTKVTVKNGRGTISKKFDSSRVWRVKALSVSSPSAYKTSSKTPVTAAGKYSNYSPVVARTKSATKKKPWIYATPAVKKENRAVFLLQWQTPYPSRTTRVYLQYYNGRKWVNYTDELGSPKYYEIPKGSTTVVASAVVTKTYRWRFKTSAIAQPKGKPILYSNSVTVKAIK